MRYSSPEPIQPTHDLTTFNCEKAALNDWLRNKALENETQGASRTYVVCCGEKVVGYYSLAAASVNHSNVPGKIKRNMPDPIPVMLLGKLAVDINHKNRGLGKGLVKDAIQRILQASAIAGIRAILVHAIDEDAKRFYVEKCGFMSSPIDPLILLIKLTDAQKNLA